MRPYLFPSASPRSRGWRVVAVTAALLCAPLFTLAGAPGAALAQSSVEAPPTVELIQLTGKWETSVGPMEIVGGGPGNPNNRALVTGHVTNAQGQKISFAAWLFNGKPKGQGFENNWDGLKRFDAAVLPDGTLEIRFEKEPYLGKTLIAGVRSGEPTHAASPFLGRWSTSLGDLDLRAEGGHVTGTLTSQSGGRTERRIVALHAFENGRAITGLNGAWRSTSSGATGAMRIDLTQDGKRFLGSYSTMNNGAEVPSAWTGSRPSADAPPPAGGGGSPTENPPPGNQGPTPPPPPPPSAFKALNRLEVRLDRVQVARGYPTHQVHVFMTVKNTSPSPQYFTSGTVKVFLAEGSGAGQERSQPYMAAPEPAALFNSTPVIRPGGELKVRYVFNPAPQAQLDSVTVSEGDRQASFPVNLIP